jgi:hypothetical protein
MVTKLLTSVSGAIQSVGLPFGYSKPMTSVPIVPLKKWDSGFGFGRGLFLQRLQATVSNMGNVFSPFEQIDFQRSSLRPSDPDAYVLLEGDGVLGVTLAFDVSDKKANNAKTKARVCSTLYKVECEGFKDTLNAALEGSLFSQQPKAALELLDGVTQVFSGTFNGVPIEFEVSSEDKSVGYALKQSNSRFEKIVCFKALEAYRNAISPSNPYASLIDNAIINQYLTINTADYSASTGLVAIKKAITVIPTPGAPPQATPSQPTPAPASAVNANPRPLSTAKGRKLPEKKFTAPNPPSQSNPKPFFNLLTELPVSFTLIQVPYTAVDQSGWVDLVPIDPATQQPFPTLPAVLKGPDYTATATDPNGDQGDVPAVTSLFNDLLSFVQGLASGGATATAQAQSAGAQSSAAQQVAVSASSSRISQLANKLLFNAVEYSKVLGTLDSNPRLQAFVIPDFTSITDKNELDNAPVHTFIIQSRYTSYRLKPRTGNVNQPNFATFSFFEDDKKFTRCFVDPSFLGSALYQVLFQHIRQVHSPLIYYKRLEFQSYERITWDDQGMVSTDSLTKVHEEEAPFVGLLLGTNSSLNVNTSANLMFTVKFRKRPGVFYRTNRFITCSAFDSQMDIAQSVNNSVFNNLENGFGSDIILCQTPLVILRPCFQRGNLLEVSNTLFFQGLVSNAGSKP